jgi:hypothetical protein
MIRRIAALPGTAWVGVSADAFRLLARRYPSSFVALEGVVVTVGGHPHVRPHRHSPCHNPLETEPRVRIPLEPPPSLYMPTPR